MSTAIHSLEQLFDRMNMDLMLFDVGRHVSSLPADVFQRVESQEIVYPSPYLGHAWLALLFRDKLAATEQDNLSSASLWFIRLPLDEQGMLSLHDRDQFIQQVMIAIGNNLEAEKQQQQVQSVLENNPYRFSPTPEKQAVVHARSRQLLNIPNSDHLGIALELLQKNCSDWQQLPIQGLAELATDWENHEALLLRAIGKLPDQALTTLGICLESEALNSSLTSALCERLCATKQSELRSSLIRAISSSADIKIRQENLIALLKNNSGELDTESLLSMATRCYRDLTNPVLAVPFLNELSKQPQEVFNKTLGDLLYIQWMRVPLLAVINGEEADIGLKEAMRQFIGHYSQNESRTTH